MFRKVKVENVQDGLSLFELVVLYCSLRQGEFRGEL